MCFCFRSAAPTWRVSRSSRKRTRCCARVTPTTPTFDASTTHHTAAIPPLLAEVELQNSSSEMFELFLSLKKEKKTVCLSCCVLFYFIFHFYFSPAVLGDGFPLSVCSYSFYTVTICVFCLFVCFFCLLFCRAGWRVIINEYAVVYTTLCFLSPAREDSVYFKHYLFVQSIY